MNDSPPDRDRRPGPRDGLDRPRGLRGGERANDRLLPPNTYLYVTIPNVSELKTRFNKTHTGRLLQEPKLADFMGEVHKKLNEISDEVQKHIGVRLSDAFAIPDGEVSLAVLLPTDAKKLAVAAIIDFGKNRDTVDTILKHTNEGLDKAGFKKASRDFEGTQLVIYTHPKADGDDKKDDKSEKAEEPELGSQIAYAIKGSTLIASSSAVAMQDILRRWVGSTRKRWPKLRLTRPSSTWVSRKRRRRSSPGTSTR